MRRILKEAMTHRLVALVILATVSSLSLPNSVAAQTNSVSWDNGQPSSPMPGQITGSGTYTLAPGWSPSSVVLIAVPTQGGQPITQPGNQPAGGKWGPITMRGVAKGQYTVYASITFRGGGNPQNVATPTAILNVN